MTQEKVDTAAARRLADGTLDNLKIRDPRCQPGFETPNTHVVFLCSEIRRLADALDAAPVADAGGEWTREAPPNGWRWCVFQSLNGNRFCQPQYVRDGYTDTGRPLFYGPPITPPNGWQAALEAAGAEAVTS